jgi:hypothetical protein
MKEQELFTVAVTESEKIKDDNGNIDSIKKRVIFKDVALPAYGLENAKAKALAAAMKVKGEKAIKDIDEVEVTAKPFRG